MGLMRAWGWGLLAALSGALAAQAAEVHDVRLWTAPDHTRIVFDLDRRIDYRVFVLHRPERVVIDLVRTRLAADLSRLALPDPVVARIRHGHPKSGVLRIVLDLNEKGVRPRSFLLKPMHGKPHRLVVDLMREEVRPPPVQAKHGIVIAIDAGHGGEDPGAIGPHGVKEKDVTLAIARALYRRLKREPGMQPVLIRKGDYFIPLRRRVLLARRAHADLFISIHADSTANRRVKGASVYLLAENGATPDRAAEALAAKENASDAIGGVPQSLEIDPMVKEILSDMIARATLDASQLLAEELLREIGTIGPIKYRKPKRAHFVVLQALEIPSVLVEVDYLSHPRRERLLASRRHQKRIAQAIWRGVRRYLQRMGMLPSRMQAQAAAPRVDL